jgi:hypothetical protein
MPVVAACPELRDIDYSQRELYRGYIGILSSPALLADHSNLPNDRAIDVFASPAGRRIAQLRQQRPQMRIAVYVVRNNSVAKCPRFALPAGEYAYEEPGFIVLEEKGKWVRIVLDVGSGWIRREPRSEMHPYEDLARGITSLSRSWNGVLFRTPRGAKWKPKGKTDRSVEVLDSRTVHGKLWFKIRLLDRSECAVREPATVAIGWVPGYDSSRDPLVDYASRGC